MTLRVEETKVVTIDDQTLAVDTLPDNVQQLVAFYDDWKQREVDLRSELMAMQAAMRTMQQQIAQAVKASQDAVVAEAEAEAANDSSVDNVSDDTEDGEDNA